MTNLTPLLIIERNEALLHITIKYACESACDKGVRKWRKWGDRMQREMEEGDNGERRKMEGREWKKDDAKERKKGN